MVLSLPFFPCANDVWRSPMRYEAKTWPGRLILVDLFPARLLWGPIATAFTDPGPAGGGAGSWNAGHSRYHSGHQVTG